MGDVTHETYYSLCGRLDTLEHLQAATELEIEVDPGITSGDYLHGFLMGTRRALHDNGRASLTITVNCQSCSLPRFSRRFTC